MSAPKNMHWTPEEIRALGVRTNLPTACSVLGISASSGYGLVQAGKFPVRTIRVGQRIIVPVAGLLEILGIDETAPAA